MDDETAVALRNEIIAASQERIDTITQQYTAGVITLTAWVLAMRQEIEIVSSQQYLLGVQGDMSSTDVAALEAWIFEQHQYLQDFGAQVQQGSLTPGQMLVRAGLYAAAAVSLYERAVAASHGGSLPVYPSTDTQCNGNCRCSWRWVDAGDRWHAIWELDPTAKHCPDCLNYASLYSEASPYVIFKSLTERILT